MIVEIMKWSESAGAYERQGAIRTSVFVVETHAGEHTEILQRVGVTAIPSGLERIESIGYVHGRMLVYGR